MFAGIIQSLGIIENFNSNSNTIFIKTKLDLSDCKIGSSICCDGICLTATTIKKIDNHFLFSVNVTEETLKRSNMINWKKNVKINLEKSLKVGEEISGHFVYGHIDTITKIIKIEQLKGSWIFQFSYSDFFNQNYKKFIVEKGSIAINGISLTIAMVCEYYFTVSVIPHTYNYTNLSDSKENDLVNIEFDSLARYVLKNI